jgi:hypothetical protein
MPPRPKEEIEADKTELFRRNRHRDVNLSEQQYKEKLKKLNEEWDEAGMEQERG